MKNEINLMYCGNDKVFDGLLISLLSMTKHTKAPIHAFVITMDLQELNQNYKPINSRQIQYLEKMLKDVNSESSIKLFDITQMFLEESKNKVKAQDLIDILVSKIVNLENVATKMAEL